MADKKRLAGAMLMAGAFCLLADRAAIAAPATPAAPSLPQAQPIEVDVELVLQVDVSGSIDYQETQLQRKGITDALMSKDVQDAIKGGALGRIGLAVVFFSSRAYGVMSVPVNWTIVSDEKTAQAVNQKILSAPRYSGRGTSISDGLELAERMLDASPFHSEKKIIDVSGDGVNNAGRPVMETRDEVLAKSITINALPIIDETTPQDLDKYFEGCVIGGPGSFVIPAKGFSDFAVAMRRKLVLEISGLTPRDTPKVAPLLQRAAATTRLAQAGQPQLPGLQPPRPQRNGVYGGYSAKNPPYPFGCDFPMFGGFGFR